MVATDEEHELVLRSRKGDHEAFTALVRAHQRMVHAVTYRMTGSLADAEDLAQETFIQAYRQLDSFRGEAKFATWLYRVAINTSLNWTKRERRRQKVHREVGEQPVDDHDPSKAAALSQRVQEALLKLPAKQRAAVVLTAYDRLSHAEAARALGCSETTVSWRLFAARAKLRRLLKDLA